MAHQMLKAYSFLFYFLGIITSFFIGLTYAGIVEAGKNQGLAGGAIVFGYGVIAAFFGLLITLFVASKTNRKIIIRLNIVATILIIGFWGYFYLKHQKRQQEKIENQNIEQPKKTTVQEVKKETAMLNFSLTKQNDCVDSPLPTDS